MKCIAICCTTALAVATAFPVDRVWVGPTSGGLWHDAQNWDPAGRMTADDVAVFRPSGSLSLTVAYDGSNYNFAKGMRFESGTTFIGHDPSVAEDDYRGYIRLTSASEGAVFTNDFHVADGAVCVISNACIAGAQKRAAIRRTGGGTMTLQGPRWGDDWGKLAGWIFEGGVTILRCEGNNQISAPIHIRSGAVLRSPCNYAFHAQETPIEIDAGGVLDLEGAGTVYMAGFRGAGALTNVATIANLSLAGGPYRISGHVYPAASRSFATLQFSARDDAQVEADWKILLADADAFSQVRVEFPSCDGAPLGFAAGVSSFNVGTIQGNDASMLTLEDEDGAPITLTATFYNPAKFRMKGSGTFLSNAEACPIAGPLVDLSGLTGTLGATVGEVTIGDGTAVNWPQTDNRLSFVCHGEGMTGGGITFMAPAAGEVVLTNRIAGTGRYTFSGGLTLLDADTDGSWWRIRDNADVTVAGGDAVVAGYGLYLYPKSKLTVRDGAVMRGPSRMPTADFRGNVLKQWAGAELNFGRTDGTLAVAAGGHLCLDAPTTSFSLTDGGVLELFSAPADVAGDWLFDGGELHLNPATLGYTFNATPSVADARLRVGPKGLTLRALPKTALHEDDTMQFVFRRPFEPSDEAEGAGGITRRGGGFFDFWHPLTIRGTFANLDGTLRLPNRVEIREATVSLFGTGDFRLGNARIEYANAIAEPFVARLGTGGRFLYDGAATIRVRAKADSPVQTLELGELTRGSEGAALYFWDADATAGVSYNDSAAGAKVTFAQTPATTADGRIDQPVFVYAGDRFDFSRYTEAEGLKAFTAYAAWETADETKTVRTPSSVTRVTADTAVGALRVDGVTSTYGSRSPLVLEAGVTLTIGHGTTPACLILNAGASWAPATIRGAGALSFGDREGVIVANNRVVTESEEFAAIHVPIVRANGLTITRAATLNAANGVALCANNSYAGPTRVFGTRVMPRAAGAFSSGVVEIGAGELQGGVLMMDVEGLTLPNAIRAAGWGARAAADDEGSVTFAKGATLAGPVEVVDEARFVARDGARGVFAGEVSGAKVWIWKGAGEICFAADNTCTGGVEVVGSTLALTDAGTAGTGDICLNGGTLVLENEEEKTVPNRICGKGCIRLAGKGAANLPALASEDGVGFSLDLAAKVATVGSLKEISAITTRRTRPTALIVADGDVTSFAGAKPANVTLYRPGEYLPSGGLIIIR